MAHLDGPLTELASVLCVPVIRLRAAIPEALLPGSLERALGRSCGLSAEALSASAPDLLRKLRRAFHVGTAPPASGGVAGRRKKPEQVAAHGKAKKLLPGYAHSAVLARALRSAPRYDAADLVRQRLPSGAASPRYSRSETAAPAFPSAASGLQTKLGKGSGRPRAPRSAASVASMGAQSAGGARPRTEGEKAREGLPAAAIAPLLRSKPPRAQSTKNSEQMRSAAPSEAAAGSSEVASPAAEDQQQRETMVATAMVIASMCACRPDPCHATLPPPVVHGCTSRFKKPAGPPVSLGRPRYVCRAVPASELAAQQLVAATAFAPVRALKWDLNALVSVFRLMLAPSNLFTQERWLTRARTWRLVLLQAEDGRWEPSRDLALALLSHRTRPHRHVGAKAGGALSPGLGALAALASGDVDELDDVEDDVGEDGAERARDDVERCPLTGYSAAAVAWSMPEHLRLAAAQARCV